MDDILKVLRTSFHSHEKVASRERELQDEISRILKLDWSNSKFERGDSQLEGRFSHGRLT